MLKGALHIHSDISSDSGVSRHELRELFKNAGYHFLMVTEHAEDLNSQSYAALIRQYQDLSDETFCIIPGLEIKWQDRVHLLAYGARAYIGNQEHCSIEEAMRAIRETTQCDLLVCAHVNHPIRLDRKLQTALSFADGMEVLNFNYHGMRFPDSRGLHYCTRIRRRKDNFFVFSGLDMHTTKKYQAIYCLLPEVNRVLRQEIIENFSRGIFVSGSRFCLLRQAPYSAAHLGFFFLGNLYVSFARRISRKVKRMVKFLKRSDRICRLYAN